MEVNDLESLETAILISIFTDARMEQDPQSKNPRGFWGDAIFGEKTGSQIWILDRSKRNNETLNKYKNYVYESIKWLLDEKIVQKIDIFPKYNNESLHLTINITQNFQIKEFKVVV